MKTEKTKLYTFPFSRIGFLLRLSCTALLTSAALLANPPGHQKLIFDGDPVPGGDSVSISEYSNVVLASSGTAILTEDFGSAAYLTAPGSLSTLINVGMSLPDGRVLIDYGSNSDEYAINKRGDIAFYSETELASTGAESKSGIFLLSGGKIVTIIDNGKSAPGGGLYDLDDFFGDVIIKISNNGKYVVFSCSTNGGPGKGCYIADLSGPTIQVKKIAVAGDSSPDGGKFTDFYDAFAVINTGTVVYSASTTLTSQDALYAWNGTKNISIKDTENHFDFQINDKGNLMVTDSSGMRYGSISGLNYIHSSGGAAPGGGTFAFGVEYPILDNLGNIAFMSRILRGPAENGIFYWSPNGGVIKIMLTSDSPPGGGFFESANFETYYPIAIDGGKVYFQARTSGGDGIFMGDGNTLQKIIRTGDLLENQAVTGVKGFIESEKHTVDQGAFNVSGQFVYYAQLENDNGLFLYPYSKAPEIAVEQPAGTNLIDNKSKRGFGHVKVGVISKPKIFTIKNTGTATLTGLSVTKNGLNGSDFRISGLGATSLKPGKETTFQVTFKPSSIGTRRAKIHIKSNDKDESPFDISVQGYGSL